MTLHIVPMSHTLTLLGRHLQAAAMQANGACVAGDLGLGFTQFFYTKIEGCGIVVTSEWHALCISKWVSRRLPANCSTADDRMLCAWL